MRLALGAGPLARRQPAARGEHAARARRRGARRRDRRLGHAGPCARCRCPSASRSSSRRMSTPPVLRSRSRWASCAARSSARRRRCSWRGSIRSSRFRAGRDHGGRSRLRNALMAVEVALALVVLVAAGIFLRSFMETRNNDPGFRREGVLLAAYDLSGRNAENGARRGVCATAARAASGAARGSRARRSPRPCRSTSTVCRRASSRSKAGRATDAGARSGAGQHGDARLLRRDGHAARRRHGLRGPATTSPRRRRSIVNEEFVRRYLDGGEPLGRRSRRARPDVRDRRRRAQLAVQRFRRAADADDLFLVSRPSVARSARFTCARVRGGETAVALGRARASSASSIPSCRSTTSGH